MANKLNEGELNTVIEKLSEKYKLYAPMLQKKTGVFSDTDIIGYGEIKSADQIVFDKKSMYSFKEAILPISETLFYFTDEEMKEPKEIYDNAVVFLRSCDMHGLKRLDDIYGADGKKDFYYDRLRNNAKFIVMGCGAGFESCFCESMGTNKVSDYDAYIELNNGGFILDAKFDELVEILVELKTVKTEFTPKEITNIKKLEIPESIPDSIINSEIWDEYNDRCIACGRCNFACPTCSCYTMQDIFYEDNKNAGERRRVWASCQVDGFTDMAGGISYRKKKGERMRFKVLHKISDHKKRYGKNMCVGCGRCDDICPEYISFTSCIEKLSKACGEVQNG